jgi:heat shock protein HslJ
MSSWAFGGMIALLAFLVGCSNSTEVSLTSLRNSTWQLDSFDSSGHTKDALSNQVYTLHFDTDSTVSGQVYCNTYATSYSFVGTDSIVFGPFNATKIGCPSLSNAGEFRLGFDRANSLSTTGLRLRILYYNRNRALNFRRAQ